VNRKVIVLFISVLSFLCARQTSMASETGTCVPNSAIFLLKNISGTISKEDTLTIRKLTTLNKEQIEAWINPIPNKEDYSFEYVVDYKAVSLLKETSEYYLLLLMQCEEDAAVNAQFIVSVDKQGKYIDALAVSYVQNLSNSDVEFDPDRNIYRFSTLVKSFFEGDSIKVTLWSSVSNLPNSHEETDYWEELDEIIYTVKGDGNITVLEPRKKRK